MNPRGIEMSEGAAAAQRPFSTRLAWSAVGVLMVAYTFSFIDRSILSLLVVPVRRDLNISDTQFSLLHGLAFAVFYTALGIPIARLADRYSRRAIITASVLVWSVATVACGLARNFTQLFAARVVVGVGEAGLSPAAYSMIADMFPKESLGRALAAYSTGVFMGGGLALIIGGVVVSAVGDSATFAVPVLGEVRSWQVTFFLVGAPGVLIALLTWMLREPQRQPGPAGTATQAVPFREVLAFVAGNRATFLTHFLGFSSLALLYNAVFAWSPALLIRRFGVAGGDAGLYLGVITLVFATAGIMAGGWTADRFDRAGRDDAPIRTGLIAAVALIPLIAAAPLMPNLTLALIAYCPLMFFISFPWAAAAAGLQIVSPPRMRAQISALYLFVVNLAGIGLGPFATALVTDYVFQDDGALPYSLALVGVGAALLGSILLYRGLVHFRLSIARQAG
jgi:MFS family permease